MSEIQECSQQEDTECGMCSEGSTDSQSVVKPRKYRKIPKTVSFNDFKAATSVLSAGCLKELKNIVRCSDFVLSDDADSGNEPTENPSSEKREDDNEGDEKESAGQQDSADDFEIRSMTTAALVISKGCTQELKKLVSCSEFPMTDDDDMEEQGEEGEEDGEEGEAAEEDVDGNDKLLSPNVHRSVQREYSSSGVETEIEHIEMQRSIRRQQCKQVQQQKQQKHEQKRTKETEKPEPEKNSEEKPPKEQPNSVEVELHCSENQQREVKPKQEETKSEPRKSRESRPGNEDPKPVMIYEPKRGSYKARKSISLNDFKSSTVVISNAGAKNRSHKTKTPNESQVLEDKNEEFYDDDDEEGQQPVLREDENYYAECMSLAQSSSCVTLADQDAEEIVYDTQQALYETISQYEDTSYMHTKSRRDKSCEKEKKEKKSRRHEDEYVVNRRGQGVERSKVRDHSTQSYSDRRHSRAESETHAKKKEVSIDDMLKLVSGMLSEVTDSLERLNKCSEKSASMNNSPIQSPVPMRRKYRLLQNNEHINSKYKQVRACSSLPRNFYPGCHFRSQISDVTNLDSDGLSSIYDNLPEPVVHAPCELHSRSDRLRVVLLKRKMYERYPQHFPDPPGSNWYDTGVNIVSYDTHRENPMGIHSRSFREPCRYSNYYVEGIEVGKRSLEREYDICSDYYETVD